MCWYCNMAMFHSYVFSPGWKRKGSYMFSVKLVHWTGGKVSRVQFRFTSSLWKRLERGTGQEICWGSISKNQMFIICCLMFVGEFPIARMDVLFFSLPLPQWLDPKNPEAVWSWISPFVFTHIYIYYMLLLMIIVYMKDRYAHDNLYPPIMSATIFGETHRFSFCG